MLFGVQIGHRTAAVMSSIPVAPSFRVRRYASSIRSMSIRRCSDVKTRSGCEDPLRVHPRLFGYDTAPSSRRHRESVRHWVRCIARISHG